MQVTPNATLVRHAAALAEATVRAESRAADALFAAARLRLWQRSWARAAAWYLDLARVLAPPSPSSDAGTKGSRAPKRASVLVPRLACRLRPAPSCDAATGARLELAPPAVALAQLAHDSVQLTGVSVHKPHLVPSDTLAFVRGMSSGQSAGLLPQVVSDDATVSPAALPAPLLSVWGRLLLVYPAPVVLEQPLEETAVAALGEAAHSSVTAAALDDEQAQAVTVRGPVLSRPALDRVRQFATFSTVFHEQDDLSTQGGAGTPPRAAHVIARLASGFVSGLVFQVGAAFADALQPACGDLRLLDVVARKVSADPRTA